MSAIEVDPKLSSLERKQCHALFPNRSPKLHQTGFNCTYKKRLERAQNTASTQRECQKNVRAYSQQSSVQGGRGNAAMMAANAKTLLLSLDRDLSLYKSPFDRKIQAEFYSPYSQTSQHISSGGDFSVSFVQQQQQNSVAKADTMYSSKVEQFTSSVLRKAKNMLQPTCQPSQSGTAECRQKLNLKVHRLQQNLIFDNQMANALNSSDDGDETRTSATLKKNNRSVHKVVSESHQTINVLEQSVAHSKSFLSSKAQQKLQQKSSVFAQSMHGSSTLLQDSPGQAQNATFAVASADDSSLTPRTPRTATATTFTQNTPTANSQLLQKKRRELKQLINSLIRRERSRQHGAQQRTYYQDPILSNTATLMQCQNLQQKNPELKAQGDQSLRGKSISPMLQISRIQRSPQQQNGANSRRFLSSTPKMYGTSICYHNSPTRLRDEQQQYQNRSVNGCSLPITPAGNQQLQYLRGSSADQNLSPEQCRYTRANRRLAANKENAGGAESVLNVLPFPFQQFTVQNITILDVHSLIDDGKLERWNAEQGTAGGTGGDNYSLAMSQASLRNAVEQQWLGGNAENDRQDKYPAKKNNSPHRRYAEKSTILSPRKNRKRKYTHHQPNIY